VSNFFLVFKEVSPVLILNTLYELLRQFKIDVLIEEHEHKVYISISIPKNWFGPRLTEIAMSTSTKWVYNGSCKNGGTII
jgi:hypothetical protein